MFCKTQELKSGKSKTLFCTESPHHLIMLFRDDATAFNAQKKATFARKGLVNNHFNAFIMQKLQASGIPCHFEKILSNTESLVKRLEMIPIECVIRNIATGSLCKRLQIPEGMELSPPIFEFFYKSDLLGDPMINDSHILTFQWASEEAITTLKTLTARTNAILKPLFLQAGLLLVDYKLEFGYDQGKLVLGDEFTPDGCRIWDIKTRKKLDKDRFRQDLGEVIEAYEEVARRLNCPLP
ncbi:MAG: phosphoribosylaminoimidazolesuccinocarboxamide synthase [Gammaproteobacteria bacterium]|nr:phosphoribosylaminoimidazolesuccinocarboxamide synthase [Gammaproteobacteria bacterium]